MIAEQDYLDELIGPERACHVLHAYGKPGGYGADPFTTNLIASFQTAGQRDFAVLEQAFPGYGAAVKLAREHQDGIAVLDRIASGIDGSEAGDGD